MKTKAYNMKSRNGNDVPNQFEIYTDDGVYFQSYGSIIAFKPCDGKTQLDKKLWCYSRTTSRYLNQFCASPVKKKSSKKSRLANMNWRTLISWPNIIPWLLLALYCAVGYIEHL